MGTDAGFDREAAERVMARAVELDHVAGADTPPDHVVTSALVEAAEELGLDPELVRVASAEEQLGLLDRAPGLLDRMVGPSQLVARATMSGSVAAVLDALDGWMVRKAGVRRVSIDLQASTAEYLRRSDMVAGAQRTVRSAVGRANLGSLKRLELRVAALDDHRCMVVAVGDVAAERTATVAGASGLAIGGMAASTGFAVAGTEVLWLGVPGSLAVGAGVLLMRAHTVAGLQERLDAALGRAVEATATVPKRLPTVTDLRGGIQRAVGTTAPGAGARGSSGHDRGRR